MIIFTPDLGKVGQTFKDSTSALRRTDSWYDFLPRQGPRTHRWGQFALAAPFRLSRKPSFAEDTAFTFYRLGRTFNACLSLVETVQDIDPQNIIIQHQTTIGRHHPQLIIYFYEVITPVPDARKAVYHLASHSKSSEGGRTSCSVDPQCPQMDLQGTNFPSAVCPPLSSTKALSARS